MLFAKRVPKNSVSDVPSCIQPVTSSSIHIAYPHLVNEASQQVYNATSYILPSACDHRWCAHSTIGNVQRPGLGSRTPAALRIQQLLK
ncbi:hypothetical protein SERLA73DRAFT_191295 [Serpula lacrymans var. lacrymans S7.3]|uniref:Uncharacterized protein n=2 Tax=Serpula lacrymans var. lacrymans TaxID=341189 RepID=F8QH88_SERL3|nr:uncharacterized protein SERLADRAFT_459916 [Serpula lacrymans var. lacrymans S7.9]EGN92337.1 hypothetical protein SERLA73DRAFT_191295 [Serpula lacrymans var. lacrymans S7.3]EGO27089.1 hypothetical protein SERLADRAFT_459916 [Serpula lacrymans var. lacrymans S7.9]